MCPISCTTVSRISRTASPRVGAVAQDRAAKDHDLGRQARDGRPAVEEGHAAEDAEELLRPRACRSRRSPLRDGSSSTSDDDVFEVLAEMRPESRRGPPRRTTRTLAAEIRAEKPRPHPDPLPEGEGEENARSSGSSRPRRFRSPRPSPRRASSRSRRRRPARRACRGAARARERACPSRRASPRAGRPAAADADVLGRPERDHSGEGDEVAEVDRLLSVGRVLGEGVEDARPAPARRGEREAPASPRRSRGCGAARATRAAVRSRASTRGPRSACPAASGRSGSRGRLRRWPHLRPPRERLERGPVPGRIEVLRLVGVNADRRHDAVPACGSSAACAESASVVPGTRNRVTPAARARAISSSAPSPICRWQWESASTTT